MSLMRQRVHWERAPKFPLRPEVLDTLAMWLPRSCRLENLGPLGPKFQIYKIRMKRSYAQGDQDFDGWW